MWRRLRQAELQCTAPPQRLPPRQPWASGRTCASAVSRSFMPSFRISSAWGTGARDLFFHFPPLISGIGPRMVGGPTQTVSRQAWRSMRYAPAAAAPPPPRPPALGPPPAPRCAQAAGGGGGVSSADRAQPVMLSAPCSVHRHASYTGSSTRRRSPHGEVEGVTGGQIPQALLAAVQRRNLLELRRRGGAAGGRAGVGGWQLRWCDPHSHTARRPSKAQQGPWRRLPPPHQRLEIGGDASVGAAVLGAAVLGRALAALVRLSIDKPEVVGAVALRAGGCS